jgi:hypothetical protein
MGLHVQCCPYLLRRVRLVQLHRPLRELFWLELYQTVKKTAPVQKLFWTLLFRAVWCRRSCKYAASLAPPPAPPPLSFFYPRLRSPRAVGALGEGRRARRRTGRGSRSALSLSNLHRYPAQLQLLWGRWRRGGGVRPLALNDGLHAERRAEEPRRRRWHLHHPGQQRRAPAVLAVAGAGWSLPHGGRGGGGGGRPVGGGWSWPDLRNGACRGR